MELAAVRADGSEVVIDAPEMIHRSIGLIAAIGADAFEHGLEVRDYLVTSLIELNKTRAVSEDASNERQLDLRRLLALATGLGKTTIVACEAAIYFDDYSVPQPTTTRHFEGSSFTSLLRTNRQKRFGFFAHELHLAEQAMHFFKQLFPHLSFAFLAEGQKDTRDTHFLFGTLQSLGARLYDYDREEFGYLTIDEAHHGMAHTYRRVIEYFKPAYRRLGITATPYRSDQQDITEIYGESVYSKSLAVALGEGWLTMPDYRLMVDDAVREAMNRKFTSLNEINKAFKAYERNQYIVNEIKKAEQEVDDPRTVTFCRDINQALHLEKLMPGSRALHHKLSHKERRRILDDVRTGKINVLHTIDMVTEGVDLPDTNILVMLQSNEHRGRWEQQLGRGVRRRDNKKRVIVLDFAANVERLFALAHFFNDVSQHYGEYYRGESEISRPGKLLQFSPFTEFNFNFSRQDIDLLEKIQNLLKRYERAPEGWKTAAQIALEVGTGAQRIFLLADRLKIKPSNPMLSVHGVPAHHFSPDDSQRLLDDYKRIPWADREQELESTLAASKRLQVSRSSILGIADELGIGKKMRTERGQAFVFNATEQTKLTAAVVFNKCIKEQGWITLRQVHKNTGIPLSAVYEIAVELGIQPLPVIIGSKLEYITPGQAEAIEARRKTKEQDWRAGNPRNKSIIRFTNGQ